MVGPYHCCIEADALLFDLDGVLVNSTASVERLWRAFAEEQGIDGDALMEDLHGRRMIDIMAGAVPHLPPLELEEQARRFDALEARDAHAAVALAGAVDLTEWLEQHGSAWAIVTSGTVAVSSARIEAVGLPTPPVLVTADEVAAGKPAPDPYLAAAQGLGIAPSRCVVVEDAPSGIRAGNAAGATTVAVTTSHDPVELAHAAHRVGSVADLCLATSGATASLVVRLGCLVHVDDRP